MSQSFTLGQILTPEIVNNSFRVVSRAVGGGVLEGMELTLAFDRIEIASGVYQTPNGIIHTLDVPLLIGTGGIDTAWATPVAQTTYTVVVTHLPNPGLRVTPPEYAVIPSYLATVVDGTVLGYVRHPATALANALITSAEQPPYRLRRPIHVVPPFLDAVITLEPDLTPSLAAGLDNRPLLAVDNAHAGFTRTATYRLLVRIPDDPARSFVLAVASLPAGGAVTLSVLGPDGAPIPTSGAASLLGPVTDAEIDLAVDLAWLATANTMTPGSWIRVDVQAAVPPVSSVQLGEFTLHHDPYIAP